MKESDFDVGFKIRPWKPKAGDVPHLTIETNLTCNFRCASCYNMERDYVKPLELIKEEIDLGLQIRKADTVTLLGGEPTLHPHLKEVIAYLAEKKVVVQLLTNGFLFLGPGGDKLLSDLKNSGLTRLMLHVDYGQKEYDDPVKVLHRLIAKTEKINLLTSVSWTIYPSGQGKIGDIIREFSCYRNFDGMLCLLENPLDEVFSRGSDLSGLPDMLTEYQALKNGMDLLPSIFLPSSSGDKRITWLIYLYYINTRTQATFYVSPRLTQLYRNLYLAIKRRDLFGTPPMRSLFLVTLFVVGVIESLVQPARMLSFFRLLRKSSLTKDLRYQYLAIQDGPKYDPVSQAISICYHCPDATIRNGMITPVCLADRINPLPGRKMPDNFPPEVAETVFNHLE